MSLHPDEDQKIIIESKSPAIKLVAGPGTGKSKTMEWRVSNLLKDGINAENILCCTFTKNAATALKENLPSINPTTIHAHCLKILQDNKLFLKAKDRSLRIIVSEFEKKILLHDLKKFTELKQPENEKILTDFEASWAKFEIEPPFWAENIDWENFNKHLNNWLAFHKAILIGELVSLTYEFLKDNPACSYREKYEYIIVDEYQDLNKIDQEIIKLFINDSTKIMVVGDADQSIYSFRHAYPEGMNKFEEIHSPFYTKDEIIKSSLEICYRCPKLIVKLANNLIAKNTKRQDEYELAPNDKNSDGDIQIVQWDTEEEELRGISNYFKKITAKEENNEKKILLLVPTNPYGNKISEQLIKMEIDLNNLCKKKINYKEEKAISLLRLLNNCEDRVSLRVWFSFSFVHEDQCKPTTYNCLAWNTLTQQCKEKNISPWQALDDAKHKVKISAKMKKYFENLEIKLNELDKLAGNFLIDRLFPADEEWAKHARENCFRINKSNNDNVDKKTLLNELQDIEKENNSIVPGSVNMMTLHKSKGLTADIVVIIGCAEGLMPSSNLQNPIEEKRRLFYVGLTRTKDVLILSAPHLISTGMQKTNSMERSDCVMSSFISEANRENERHIITPISGKTFIQLHEL